MRSLTDFRDFEASEFSSEKLQSYAQGEWFESSASGVLLKNAVNGDEVAEISSDGTFTAQYIYTPIQGVAVQINAFNFPCWGMLEKLAPMVLAGVPTVVKPASQTAFLTELMVQHIIESGILPERALQLVCGRTGDLLTYLDCQDAVAEALSARLAKISVGDPNVEGVRMGSLAGLDQRQDVEERLALLAKQSEIVFGGNSPLEVQGANAKTGAFMSPMLLACGSEQTARISEFGSTACKALFKCSACLEPFDYFKQI